MDIPQVISAISAVFIMATFAQSCVLGGSLKDRVGQAHLKQNGYLKKNINMTSVKLMNAPLCFKIHCSEKNWH